MLFSMADIAGGVDADADELSAGVGGVEDLDAPSILDRAGGRSDGPSCP